MNFLKKLATPFIAVGRWIKETAWVQPLLIVGIIFAIIFSIPSITSAIQNAQKGASDDILWYQNHQLSLDGTADDDDKDSQANVFFKDFDTAQDFWTKGNKTEAKATLDKYSDNEGKFFLFFVQDGCTACNEAKEASQYLIDNWSDLIGNETDKTYTSFKYQSIIADQTVDSDNYDKTKPFDFLLGDGNFLRFADQCNYVGTINNYYIHSDSTVQNTIKTNLDALVSSDPTSSSLSSNFQTPFIVLIDTTEENTTTSIIKTLFFSCEGDNRFDRATFLANCWKSEKKFSDKGE